jgi:hypothetical protein
MGFMVANPCCILASFHAAHYSEHKSCQLRHRKEQTWIPKSTSSHLLLQNSPSSSSHCIQCRPRREYQSWLTRPQPSSQQWNDIKPQTSQKCNRLDQIHVATNAQPLVYLLPRIEIFDWNDSASSWNFRVSQYATTQVMEWHQQIIRLLLERYSFTTQKKVQNWNIDHSQFNTYTPIPSV